MTETSVFTYRKGRKMRSAPVIGITGYVEQAKYTVWDAKIALLPYTYIDHVVRAGGQPVILPPAGDLAPLAGRLDGLILAGGGDIDPVRYGEDPHEKTAYIREFRDDAEFALVDAAVAARLPMLAICRGLEVLNVARGGTLHQHLPDIVGTNDHSPALGRYGRLAAHLIPGTRLAKIFERDDVDGAHYHHQAINRLGDGLTVAARSSDGVIEAVELDDHPFCLAVQWHPEMDDDNLLFEALVSAAGEITRG
jgi:anthranilate synthase component 2/putative glutamine amidotransferase